MQSRRSKKKSAMGQKWPMGRLIYVGYSRVENRTEILRFSFQSFYVIVGFYKSHSCIYIARIFDAKKLWCKGRIRIAEDRGLLFLSNDERKDSTFHRRENSSELVSIFLLSNLSPPKPGRVFFKLLNNRRAAFILLSPSVHHHIDT